ncbi:Rho GTPase activation protein [Xylaria venustula]|nr:Rho GTPase activation protein [Xylaria venustula]
MDPLSVSASIVGLITAGAKISQILAQVVRKARDAPSEFQHVQVEVDSIQVVLGQLQLYLLGTLTASRSRTSLILVDQVIASLATCVATFSELDSFADALKSESDMDVLDIVRWMAKEDEIKQILTRLESHKANQTISIEVLLRYFGQKQDDAEDKVDRLCDLVQQTLQSNLMLARRLEVFELAQTQTSGQAVGGHHVNSHKDYSDTPINPISVWGELSAEPAFEQLLVASRPYRNAPLHNSDAFSAISSARQTGSWSRLSGLSLSEISHIGILAIPVYETDISNKEAYDFNTTTAGFTVSVLDREPSTSCHRRSPEYLTQAGPVSIFVSRPSIDEGDLGRKRPYALGQTLHHTKANAYRVVNFREGWGPATISVDVPAAIFEVAEFIKTEGMNVFKTRPLGRRYSQEIFIREGDIEHIAQLEKAFHSTPGSGENFNWDGYTVYDAASFLIRLLRTCPEPLVSRREYNNFTTALAGGRGIRLGEKGIRKLIKKYPTFNQGLPLYLIDLFAMLSIMYKKDEKTARLATVFKHIILREDMSPNTNSVSHRYIPNGAEFLIKHRCYHLELLPQSCHHLLSLNQTI